jgi:two-component system chemotaxis response regulator CheB
MPIRVLVVEDSLTVRKRLVELLEADPDIRVVGEAEDGKRAIELCQQLRPDVITLDMMLPVMTGLAATEYIMAYFPTPILVVSASTNRGELFRTYDALAAGAVDVLDKAGTEDGGEPWEKDFVAKVKLVSRVRVITHPRARLSPSTVVPAEVALHPQDGHRVLGIGASTGGPGALLQILRSMTRGLPVPLLVVLHIDERFGTAFADWLDAQSPHPAAYARSDELVAAARGRVLVAPPGAHMVVRCGRIQLIHEAPRHSCRPSVDVLFESLAAEYGRSVVGCLLTGMGRDGASGLLAIRQAGGRTIAQDEATSIVYGMPREAALNGSAERILPLPDIGPTLCHMIGSEGQGA